MTTAVRSHDAILSLPLPTPALVVLAGAAGAGKSTLSRLLADQLNTDQDPGVLISYDACREELTGDMPDQAATAAGVVLAHQRIAARCAARRTTVVDATHTTAERRRPVREIAGRHSMLAVLVVVATPVALCLARQLTRPPRAPGAQWGRRVPPEVVRTQHAELLASLPGLHTEGWHSVHVLHTRHLAERTV